MRQLWLMVCAAFLMLAACTVPGATPSAGATPGPSAAPLPTPAASAGAGELPAASGEDSQAKEADRRNEARTAALEGCVAFGEGEAGVSLKTAIAAAGLLNWAEASARDSSIDAMTAHLSAWLAEQDAERQALFWANWPAVDEQAWAMVRDLPGQLPLLADAGDPQKFDQYTPACYERLHCAVEKYLEAD